MVCSLLSRLRFAIAKSLTGAVRARQRLRTAHRGRRVVRLEVIQADITTLNVDAIVNAANTRLGGGHGVNGAIHRAAGPGLQAECQSLGGCATGDAVVTGGHGLPARAVIHAVGPIWRGGDHGEEAALRSAYRRSVERALELGCVTLAFPCISAGIYGYPSDQAAKVAVETVRASARPPLQTVIFCTFREEDTRIYSDLTGAPAKNDPHAGAPLW